MNIIWILLIFLSFSIFSPSSYSQNKKTIKMDCSPSGSKVYIKENSEWKYLCSTPCDIQVDLGVKEFKFTKDWYEDGYATFNTQETIDFWTRLTKLPSPYIIVNTDVKNAEIFFEDQKVGYSKKKIEVDRKGKFKIKIRKENAKEKELEVDVIDVKTYLYNVSIKYKVGYLKMIPESMNNKYQFLSDYFTTSFETVLEKSEFDKVGTNQIIDIFDREKIILLGKQLGTDLIICGSYKLLEKEFPEKIELTTLVYDIEAGEKVIQKRIIGGADSAVYVMVDEASEMIKSEVLGYAKNRMEIIARAMKEREELEKLNSLEKKKKEEEQLRKNQFNTRLNDSQFVSTHVAKPGQLKFYLWTRYNSFLTDNVMTDSNYDTNPTHQGKTSSKAKYSTLMGNLTLAIGLGAGFELGYDQTLVYDRWVKQTVYKFLPYTGEVDPLFKSAMFNPIFYIKWKMVTDENQGINLAIKFAFQPNLKDEYFSNSIFHASNYSNSTAYHLGLYSSKTIGDLTPYIDFTFTLNKSNPGKVWTSITKAGTESFVSGYEKTSDQYYYQYNIKIGAEYRFNSWFIIQPSYAFIYMGEINWINYDTTYSGYFYHCKYQHFNIHVMGLNSIFVIGNGISLSLAFGYSFSENMNYSFRRYNGNVYNNQYLNYVYKMSDSYSILSYITVLFN